MKAIMTKYKGPTNHHGSRIIASDEDGNRVIVPYNHALNSDQMHRAAADALCAKMGWTGELIQGGIRNGYVFVWKP